MDVYMHDSTAMFWFVLRGELRGDRIAELQQAGNCAIDPRDKRASRRYLRNHDCGCRGGGVVVSHEGVEDASGGGAAAGVRGVYSLHGRAGGGAGPASRQPILTFWRACNKAAASRRGDRRQRANSAERKSSGRKNSH